MPRFSNSESPRKFVSIINLVRSVGLIFALVFNIGNSQGQATIPQPATGELLEQIGEWQGVTQEAKLERPHEDPRQQEIPFGRVSFYLTPWRAYMDTWPAQRYLSSLGINFNVPPADAKTTARILADAGFGSARVEVGWGNLGYYALRNVAHRNDYRQIFQALKDAGIRPLVLLNSNSGS